MKTSSVKLTLTDQSNVGNSSNKISKTSSKIINHRSEKALECGPLEYRFSGSRSKILDFLLVFREFDYSITDIAKNSGLSLKTVLYHIKILQNQNIITFRNVGKTIMFKLDMDSKSVQAMEKMAMYIATERITR